MRKIHRFFPCRIIVAIFLPFIAFLSTGNASAQSIDDVVKSVQGAHASLKDFKADFTQDIQAAGRNEKASGTLYVKMPGMLRWDYAAPQKKTLITDGKTLWMDLPAQKQVYEQPLEASASARVPLQMLTGRLNFKDDYDAALIEGDANLYGIRLSPKRQGLGFQNAVLWVDRKTFRVIRFEMLDLLNAKTVVSINNAKYNAGLADSLFAFKPAAGVQVIKVPTP